MKKILLLLCIAFMVARFQTLDGLMKKFNTLTRHQQATAKIATQPAYQAVSVDWFLIYDEDTI